VKCDDARAQVSAYLDGELGLEASLAIERHVAECAECAALLRRRRALSSVIASSVHAAPCPAKVRHSVERMIRTSIPTPRGRILQGGWRWASAAALLAVAGGALVLVRARVDYTHREVLVAQQVVSNHIRSLLADHAIDVASSDRHVVKPWFAGKLDFAPTVPDLSQSGFELLGGRWEYLEGHDAAALVYKRRRHVINLFIWPGAELASAAEDSGTERGYQFVHWVQNGTSYWAVSDLNLEELKQFAAAVRSAGATSSP
jgi:anti-sigma factor RsiW